MTSEPLMCPSCASTYPLEARFCPRCRMPLVYAGANGLQAPSTERHERARRVKPQFAQGELVRVAAGRNQAEAEFIQALLLQAELLPGSTSAPVSPVRLAFGLLVALALVAAVLWLGTELIG